METVVVEKVVVPVRITNVYDLHEVTLGTRTTDAVRTLDVPEALVDAGASTLCLPKNIVAQLGLQPLRTRMSQTVGGPTQLRVFGTVRLTVQGRECTCDVVEIPDSCPVLVGQVPLELLDFVVDPARQKLIGNPAHGGEHIIEVY